MNSRCHFIAVPESFSNGGRARRAFLRRGLFPLDHFLRALGQRARWVTTTSVSALLLFGCAPRVGSPAHPAIETQKTDPIQLPATIVTANEALSLEELFERADKQQAEQEYESAARSYELALEHSTTEKERLRALFGLGTALDLGAHPGEALRAYARYVSEAKAGPTRDEINVRQVRLLVYLERYEEAGRASLQVDLKERTPLQQLALLAARAHFDLARGELDAAARNISRARAIVDAEGLDRVTTPPLDVASLFFALGELRARRAEEIKFNPLPPDFAQALEERCRHILDAQSAYSETMRSADAHWSSMAGVKVGQLYKNLHADIMAVPIPAAATTPEKKQLFDGAMRLRYSILLRKSLGMMEATVALLERTHQASRWREKAQEALEEIRAAQAAEEQAIDALPYSRAQLQQVLDEMAEKEKSNVTSSPGS